MKVIFLDIDGVLNSSEYRRHLGMRYFSEIIDRRKMPLLKEIVDVTDAKIVLSTTWRKYWNEGEKQVDPAGQYIHDILAEYGLTVYSKTPVMENTGRAGEIKAWLKKHPYADDFVILDDKDFGWPAELCTHFIRTDLNGDGLDDVQVRDVIAVLNGKLLPVMEQAGRKKNRLRAWLKSCFKRFK